MAETGQESIHEENIDASSQVDIEDNHDHDRRETDLARLKLSLMTIYEKVEEQYHNDPTNYHKAIGSFTTQTDKVKKSGGAVLQKTLHTFNKSVTLSGKEIGRQIPVQATARSRRTYKIRGQGPSKAGRPSMPQQLRQLVVEDDNEYVAHSIPSNRKKRKTKNPHSLSASVTANRAAERKH